MNDLSHKLAVASVCTALAFVLGASPKAKAASFTFPPTITFEVIDLEEGSNRFDGLGDLVFPGNFSTVVRGTFGEAAQFAEFNISSFSFAPNSITNAIFQAEIFNFDVVGLGVDTINPGSLGIFGYVGNGAAEASNFEAGIFLSAVDVSSSSPGDILNFEATPFVNQRVSNGDTFAGFGIRALNLGSLSLHDFGDRRPRLIVETADVAVPEPTTIFGSAIGLGLGGWLKRKKLSQKNKTAP